MLRQIQVNFAGCLIYFVDRWEEMTEDSFILKAIRGYEIDFEFNPYQEVETANFSYDKEQTNNVSVAINKLLNFKAIESCEYVEGQFVSSFFTIPKSDGSLRFILNLRRLNVFIRKEHFKIEDIRTVLNLLDHGDYMCKLDLKDAYLFVPIHNDFKKYLRFKYDGTLFQFKALPFGLTSAPYLITKIIRSILSYLRGRGIRIVVYLDDFLIIDKSRKQCETHTRQTADVVRNLGFLLNEKKSIFWARKICTFLSVNINSVKFTLELPWEKESK